MSFHLHIMLVAVLYINKGTKQHDKQQKIRNMIVRYPAQYNPINTTQKYIAEKINGMNSGAL